MIRFLSVVLGVSLIAVAGPALADDRAASMEHYRRGNAALLEGDPATARVELLNAIKADPANAAAHLMQGLVYVRLGDGVAAEAEIRRARETGMDPSATRHLMAEALLLQGAAQRAVDETEPAGVAPRYAAWAARARGRAFAQIGDMPAAAEAFARATELGPNDPEVWSDAGRFRALNGDAVGALQAADQAVALDQDNLDAVILKGELTRTQYGLAAALPWFDRALAADPGNVAALLEKAATLGELGRMAEMLATTRQVIALDARNPVAFYLQAVMAARARNFALAGTLLRATRGAMDGVPAVMLLQAAVDHQAGNTEQAIDRLARLVAMQPDNLKARRLLGAVQFRAADYNGVIGTLRQTADGPQADTYSLILVGRALEQLGDRAAAAVYLDRAALPLSTPRPVTEAAPVPAANPADPNGLIRIGDAWAAQGRFREASEAYRQAANIGFTEPVALRLVDALRRAGNGAAADRALTIFLQQNPQSIPARLLAADRAMAAGQWADGIAILEGLRRRLGDRDAALLDRLARAYPRTGKSAKALPLAAAAYALLPGSPAFADSYGWLLVATKTDPGRGLTLLEQAAAQVPADPAVRWHLASAYAAVGRRAEARAEAEAALALPGFAERQKATALLAKL